MAFRKSSGGVDIHTPRGFPRQTPRAPWNSADRVCLLESVTLPFSDSCRRQSLEWALG